MAHALFYLTKPGDFVIDAMAGGGVVSDACLIFERKCQSFDLVTSDNKPEIHYHHWDPQNWKWPITKKPDLIFFDPYASPERERWRAGPPYYSKKEKEYEKKANSSPQSRRGRKENEYFSFC